MFHDQKDLRTVKNTMPPDREQTMTSVTRKNMCIDTYHLPSCSLITDIYTWTSLALWSLYFQIIVMMRYAEATSQLMSKNKVRVYVKKRNEPEYKVIKIKIWTERESSKVLYSLVSWHDSRSNTSIMWSTCCIFCEYDIESGNRSLAAYCQNQQKATS
jgi:hypothetical protein